MNGVEFKGTKELEAIFDSMSKMDVFKFFATEFKPVGNMITRAMRAQTPVYQGRYWKSVQYPARNHARGTLRESIGMKVGGKQIPVVWVSLNRKNKKDAWYQHMVVGGHSYGNVTVRPNPIVMRTWDAVGSSVESELEKRLSGKLKAMMQ